MELLIVTGMSGSGKSAVTDALEDLGYFCADNMPPALIPTIAQFIHTSHETNQKVATVTDIRVGENYLQDFKKTFDALEKMNYEYNNICGLFENNGISFIPLKGAHPRFGIQAAQNRTFHGHVRNVRITQHAVEMRDLTL